MTLGVASKVFWFDIHDAPFVHHAVGDMACLYKIAQPLRGVGIELVIVSDHGLVPLKEKDRQRKPPALQIATGGY